MVWHIFEIVLGSGAFFSALFVFIQWLFSRRDARKANDLDLRSGVMCLLQDKLIFLTEKSIDKGEISCRQMEMLTEMYESYKKLGGNGYVEDNFERCKELKRI